LAGRRALSRRNLALLSESSDYRTGNPNVTAMAIAAIFTAYYLPPTAYCG